MIKAVNRADRPGARQSWAGEPGAIPEVGGGESGAMRLFLPLSPCQPWGEKSGWRWSYGGEDQNQNMAIDAGLRQSWRT
jgi:hypothetical protein